VEVCCRNGRPVVKYSDTAVICAKTAEPIEMLFGLLAGIGRRNHVLDAVTGFVGYNFGCMIASDMLFDSGGGFRGQAIR